MFKLIGIAVGMYTLIAVAQGEVYAKSGLWGRTISRSKEPTEFWLTIVVYAALAAALVLIF